MTQIVVLIQLRANAALRPKAPIHCLVDWGQEKEGSEIEKCEEGMKVISQLYFKFEKVDEMTKV